VTRAASRDERGPILTGVLLEVSREGLTMVATDSYRLSVRELPATADQEAKVLIPERALAEVGRVASAEEKGQAELFIGESQATVRVGTLTLTSRLIEGEFPNYRQLLPERYESQLTGSRQQLVDAVRRVGTARPGELARAVGVSTHWESGSRRRPPTSEARLRWSRRRSRATTSRWPSTPSISSTASPPLAASR
jgi:DNA polymerase-3 subunit beta